MYKGRVFGRSEFCIIFGVKAECIWNRSSINFFTLRFHKEAATTLERNNERFNEENSVVEVSSHIAHSPLITYVLVVHEIIFTKF